MRTEEKLVGERTGLAVSVDVTFLTGPEMKRLNRAQTGRSSDTDVLSFNFDEARGSRYFLGEIYISADRMKRQARDYGHPVRTEMALLFIHGLLHLLGYDHVKGAGQRKVMERKQRSCFEQALAVRRQPAR